MSEEQKKQIFDYIFDSKDVPEDIQSEFTRWLVEHEGEPQTEYLMLKKWEEHSKTLFEGRDFSGLKRMKKDIRSRTRGVFWAKSLCVMFFIVAAFCSGWMISSATQEPLKETTLATSQHGIGEFVLPDGTKAYLNAGSRLTYPEVFADNAREVSLSGECFLEVRKDNGRPFRVKMNSLDIEVLGTSFGAVNKDSEGREEVILKSGSVKVSGASLDESIVLEPDQMLSYSSYEGKAELRSINTAECYRWYEDCLVFDNSRLADILSNISRRFNVEIKPMTSVSMDKRMSLTITGESLDVTMDLIASLLPIRYEIIGNTLIIRDNHPQF